LFLNQNQVTLLISGFCESDFGLVLFLTRIAKNVTWKKFVSCEVSGKILISEQNVQTGSRTGDDKTILHRVEQAHPE
jgi:hypothetical protein